MQITVKPTALTLINSGFWLPPRIRINTSYIPEEM